MSEPARDLNAAQARQIDTQRIEQLLKDVKKLSEENINALNSLTDGIPQSQLAFSQQLLEKSFGKVDLVLKIARMKDPVAEYNKHIAAGNRFQAAKSVVDVGKFMVEVLEKTLKINVDVAILIAERQKMLGAVDSLKAFSKQLGHLGKVTGGLGILASGIDLVDSVRRGDAGNALKASASLVEGLGTLAGGPAALGIALSAPIKMVLVFGQVGAALRGIRLAENRRRTERVILAGDDLFCKAKVMFAYQEIHVQALLDSGMDSEETRQRKLVLNDWGRMVAERNKRLLNEMSALQTHLDRQNKGYENRAPSALMRDFNLAADSIRVDRQRAPGGGLVPVMSGAEMVANAHLVRKSLNFAAGFIVARLLEAEAIPWHAFARYELELRKAWTL